MSGYEWAVEAPWLSPRPGFLLAWEQGAGKTSGHWGCG